MTALNTIRVPVDPTYVFNRGAMVAGIEAATDFDLRGKVEDAQARDPETGHRIWVVTVIDMDQMYQPDAEQSGFRRSSEMKVRVISAHRPVPPPAQVAGFGPVVEFEGMTLTPYTDTQKCTGARDGRPHRCGARQAFSIRATGMRGRMAPATVVKIHGVLRVALSDAERLDLVARNVAKSAKPPSVGRSERRALTPKEARSLLSAIVGDRLEALFVVLIATGLRRGEALGLRWSDVDLDEAVLTVQQTLQRVDRVLMFVPPKTHRSARPVPMNALAVRALRAHRARQAAERVAAGEMWEPNDLVFASTIGTAMEPRNVNRRFDELRHRAGLDWLRLHDLRHAFATFLLDQGEELRTVMDLLGHSTIRLTADTYGHVLPTRARQATEAIDRLLGES